ncbi:Hypothetical predicted protein [Podarcis lilfordi]|uniref:Uncharacterized protein n=1 Tax=Podarcis lilfordi TaxID=74358 RepID=A0AA35K1N3_9SAUR|nr:Hypothetical predicted protein [Podarcis lilfordi]
MAAVASAPVANASRCPELARAAERRLSEQCLLVFSKRPTKKQCMSLEDP